MLTISEKYYLKCKIMKINDLRLVRKGKVREVYDLGDSLLLVASDRISAFDVIMNQNIPEKGKILNQIAIFWFERTKQFIENHIVESNFDNFPEYLQILSSELKGRSVIVKKATPFPIEFIVRGYITGSGWKSYQNHQEINGISLPEGLLEYQKLPTPIFTPTTKEESGHDKPITLDEYYEIMGAKTGKFLQEISINLYNYAAYEMMSKGLILADTKFEFGKTANDDIILIDEALTPDSSRIWLAEDYAPNKKQSQFDKQILRDYLESLNWNKLPPPPKLPKSILQSTSDGYKKAFFMITGKSWE